MHIGDLSTHSADRTSGCLRVRAPARILVRLSGGGDFLFSASGKDFFFSGVNSFSRIRLVCKMSAAVARVRFLPGPLGLIRRNINILRKKVRTRVRRSTTVARYSLARCRHLSSSC